MKQSFLTKTNKVILTTLSITFIIFLPFSAKGQTTLDPITEQLSEPQVEDYQEVEKSNFISTISQTVLQDLSQRMGVEISNQHTINFESKTWSNSCLELELEGQECLETITPGWLVTISDGKEQYIYHTDERGFNVKLQQSN